MNKTVKIHQNQTDTSEYDAIKRVLVLGYPITSYFSVIRCTSFSSIDIVIVCKVNVIESTSCG